MPSYTGCHFLPELSCFLGESTWEWAITKLWTHGINCWKGPLLHRVITTNFEPYTNSNHYIIIILLCCIIFCSVCLWDFYDSRFSKSIRSAANTNCVAICMFMSVMLMVWLHGA